MNYHQISIHTTLCELEISSQVIFAPLWEITLKFPLSHSEYLMENREEDNVSLCGEHMSFHSQRDCPSYPRSPRWTNDVIIAMGNTCSPISSTTGFFIDQDIPQPPLDEPLKCNTLLSLTYWALVVNKETKILLRGISVVIRMKSTTIEQ